MKLLIQFDPCTVSDCPTFFCPTLPPKGIAAIYLAGQCAVEYGKIINASLGKAVRKCYFLLSEGKRALILLYFSEKLKQKSFRIPEKHK